MFSSHNRNYRLENSFPRMSFAPCPYVQAKLFAKYFSSVINFLKNKRREQFNETYAIINDKAHSYALLTYYINKNNQLLQNKDIGLETVEMYDIFGNTLHPGDSDNHSAWIYYVTKKT